MMDKDFRGTTSYGCYAEWPGKSRSTATYTTTNTMHCFFCRRDLSTALFVNYVAEGPICSMCLAKMNDRSG